MGWGRGRAVPPGPIQQHFPLTHPLGFPLPICLQLTAWGWVMMGDPATPSLPPSPFKPSAFRFSRYFSPAADTGVLRGSSQHRGVPPARATPPPEPPVPSWWYRAPPSPLRTGRGDLPNGAGGLGWQSSRCDGSGSCYAKRPPLGANPLHRGDEAHIGVLQPPSCPPASCCAPQPPPRYLHGCWHGDQRPHGCLRPRSGCPGHWRKEANSSGEGGAGTACWGPEQSPGARCPPGEQQSLVFPMQGQGAPIYSSTFLPRRLPAHEKGRIVGDLAAEWRLSFTNRA